MRNIPPGDDYFRLIHEVPLQPVTDIEGLRLISSQIAKIEKIPRTERSHGVSSYHQVALALRKDYTDDRESSYANGGALDHVVLRYLLALAGLPETAETLLALGERAGVPPANLKAVLGGSRALTRQEIVHLSHALLCRTNLFDAVTPNCGLWPFTNPNFRFGITHSGSSYTIADHTASRTVEVRDDKLAINIKDMNGKPCRVSPKSAYYFETVRRTLNEDHDLTLEKYFGVRRPDDGTAAEVARVVSEAEEALAEAHSLVTNRERSCPK